MANFDPARIYAEFQIGTDWLSTFGGSDLAGQVRGSGQIRMTRGFVDQQSSFTPTNAGFTLNNRNGMFSPENPYSPLFGQIKQNLPVRLGIRTTANTWDEHVRMPDVNAMTNTAGGSSSQKLYTADKASLDVAGDIDIRMEFTPFYTRVRRQVLCGKYVVPGNQRAWFIEMRGDGQLALLTTPDGTLTSALTNLSGVTLATDAGRVAIRVTLDVDNGAGSRVYRWYSAPSIDGTWTQISTATVAGTTSIFNSTSALEVGSANNANGPFTDNTQFAGKIHAFQMYSGIAGTLVADMRPQGQGVGQGISWNDTCAAPNTWALQGDNIRLASDRIRFNGELTSLPETWDVTGNDRYVQVAATSLAGRYVSNKGALNSAIYRLYRNRTDLIGYWPLEDASGATQAANVVDATKPGELTQCVFGSTTGLDGSAGALALSNAPNLSRAVFNAVFPAAETGTSTILFYFRMDTLPAGGDNIFLTLNMAPGAALRWQFTISNTSYTWSSYDLAGNQTYASAAILFGAGASPLDQWVGMQMGFKQEGGNIRFTTTWHAVGSGIFYTHFGGGTTTAGTLGRGITRAIFGTPDSAFAGAQLAHVMIGTGASLDLGTNTFANASKAWAGETAGRRIQRLAREEGEFFEWVGDLDTTALVGAQAPDRLLNLFTSSAGVDGGLFGDLRDTRGWRYVTRAAMGNRRALTLDYSASELDATPLPITDNRYLVNDYTASRPAGSSARYEANDGRPLSTSDPDDPVRPGVGRYEQSGAFNAAADSQLFFLASAQVAVGTWPGSRIPNISVALHRDEISPSGALTEPQVENVFAQDFGDTVTLTGLASAPMAPDDKDLLTFGYTETIGQAGTMGTVMNTMPAGPYQVPILGSSDVNGEPRMDADFGHHVDVHGPYSAGATLVRLRVDQDFSAKKLIDTAGYPAEFPCDWNIAGERVTMTACTAADPNPMITPGTFEVADGGVTGWVSVGGSVTASAVFAHSGAQSALMTVSGTPPYTTIQTTAGSTPVTEGVSYTAACWVRSVVNLSDVHVFITWFDIDGNNIGTDQPFGLALVSGAWTQRTTTATAPAGATACQPGAMIFGPPASGTLLYVDDFVMSTTGFVYQIATLTRAVNGISKAITDGTETHLWDTFELGLI
jgi:hypothetical protein